MTSDEFVKEMSGLLFGYHEASFEDMLGHARYLVQHELDVKMTQNAHRFVELLNEFSQLAMDIEDENLE